MNITEEIKFNHNKSYTRDFLIDLLQKMLLIRKAELTVAGLLNKKELYLFDHLYAGQEAIAVGVCGALKTKDAVFSNHRSHGHYLAKGGDLNAFFAELYGKATGCSGGCGGSLHLCAPEIGLYGSSGIVAGSLGIGLGPALAAKVSGTDTVSVIFHGDGVPDEGIWHESLNLAAVWNLPVLYILENNYYATYLTIEERRKKNNFLELAAAHGLHTAAVDGNNVLNVYEETTAALERIHKREGPQFIECITYRWYDHFGSTDGLEKGWRSADELVFWKERCPIKHFTNYLVESRIATEQDINSINAEIDKKIEEALVFAKNSLYPQK
jgi:pyruvate dehydrogenase E1 component alpha subunit